MTITDQMIADLEHKALERIKHELRLEYLNNIYGEKVILAFMPLISETKRDNFPDDASMFEIHEYIREKVFNYFYAEIFDYMIVISKSQQSDQ